VCNRELDELHTVHTLLDAADSDKRARSDIDLRVMKTPAPILVAAFLVIPCAGSIPCASAQAPAAQTPPTQAPTEPYQPRVGQPGKDVVWVPSPEEMVERALDLAAVTPNDYVIDLGSGDGRNVISAAKRGARALGVEYNADLVQLSKQYAIKAGVSDKAS